MPRHARFQLAGVPMHVVHRGNNRQPCFIAPADRELYLGLLRELAPTSGCAIHAYVLMTNHVHLLLTPDDGFGASRLMKHVAQRYTQAFNRRWRRCGTLWQGRFHSSLIDTEMYLWRCHRYIELNPVRARMVAHPSNYEWSSYAANAIGTPDPLVTPHEQFANLAEGMAGCREVYRAMAEEPLGDEEIDEFRRAASGGYVLGNPVFTARMRSLLGPRVCPLPPGRQRNASRETE